MLSIPGSFPRAKERKPAQDIFTLHEQPCLANTLAATQAAFEECLIQLVEESSNPSDGQGQKDTKCTEVL